MLNLNQRLQPILLDQRLHDKAYENANISRLELINRACKIFKAISQSATTNQLSEEDYKLVRSAYRDLKDHLEGMKHKGSNAANLAKYWERISSRYADSRFLQKALNADKKQEPSALRKLDYIHTAIYNYELRPSKPALRAFAPAVRTYIEKFKEEFSSALDQLIESAKDTKSLRQGSLTCGSTWKYHLNHLQRYTHLLKQFGIILPEINERIEATKIKLAETEFTLVDKYLNNFAYAGYLVSLSRTRYSSYKGQHENYYRLTGVEALLKYRADLLKLGKVSPVPPETLNEVDITIKAYCQRDFKELVSVLTGSGPLAEHPINRRFDIWDPTKIIMIYQALIERSQLSGIPIPPKVHKTIKMAFDATIANDMELIKEGIKTGPNGVPKGVRGVYDNIIRIPGSHSYSELTHLSREFLELYKLTKVTNNGGETH